VARVAGGVDAVPTAILVAGYSAAVRRADAGHAELVCRAAVAARPTIDLRGLEVVASTGWTQAEPGQASVAADSVLTSLVGCTGDLAISAIVAIRANVDELGAATPIRAIHRCGVVGGVRALPENARLTEATHGVAVATGVELATRLDARGPAQAVRTAASHAVPVIAALAGSADVAAFAAILAITTDVHFATLAVLDVTAGGE
jgi:hypothetical protein